MQPLEEDDFANLEGVACERKVWEEQVEISNFEDGGTL